LMSSSTEWAGVVPEEEPAETFTASEVGASDGAEATPAETKPAEDPFA